jgi:hypothetical protein
MSVCCFCLFIYVHLFGTNWLPFDGLSTCFILGNLLGALEKLWKATVSFVISDRMEQLGSHWTDFHEICFLRIYRKYEYVDKIGVLLKSETSNGYFTWRDWYITRWILLRIRNVSDKSRGGNLNIHFVFNLFFFWKCYRLWDNVKKYGRDRQATHDNIILRRKVALCLSDN